MTTVRLLTTYRLAVLAKGDEIKWKGELWTVVSNVKKELDFLLVESNERKRNYVVINYSEIKTYTEQLLENEAAFARELAEHKRQVRSRQYTSKYWLPAPQTVYDKF